MLAVPTNQLNKHTYVHHVSSSPSCQMAAVVGAQTTPSLINYNIITPPTRAATPASRPFWAFTMPAALVLEGPAVEEAVRVLLPVLAADVCLARVVDVEPVGAAWEAPVLVGAGVELSVAEAPGVALSFSRPAVMVTGSWKVRKASTPELPVAEMLPPVTWAKAMLHEAASLAVLSTQVPPSELYQKRKCVSLSSQK
ncbi:hypothetical protein CI102_6992 [Trichoderma harzianum]|uniref:Uncharacterized protein n=1 Tax=Trichoderma harzianum CBS 226.95 TaxID=983964 RepID=A0A2T4AVC7_TRIHA|nr:hypothetical protein M431DRAFT_201979 [Trichoderma harzianum CBS 226.95]PKK47508.1 hypothetical protein CI102_6992 [Trichoderma harzianum]PTB61022.1 hypothetical protein M431DRAFT_201979 [Trichoderma harzianum CBS 226.95]